MTCDERAALISQGLSGQHLHGFLPGNDHKAAISEAVSSYHGWGGGGQGWGQVSRKGIGRFRDITDTRDSSTAFQFVTWAEVLEVVESGCGNGRRENYETAFRNFNGWAARQPRVDANRYSGDADGHLACSKTQAEFEAERAEYASVHDAIRSTTKAIIGAGCERELAQEALFEIDMGDTSGIGY
jgi:hypothetical protein